jgi:hypothetical protein
MSLIDAAYEYLGEHFAPLPLKNNKTPMLPKGHNFLYERVHEDEVEKYFEKAEKIGIACGEVSEGFYCIDFDAHNGEPIKGIFDQFIEVDYIQDMIQDGRLSLYKTPSGGYHIYCRHNQKVKGEAFARWETKSVMIEIRGDGQYTACAPSLGYEFIDGVEIVKLQYLEGNEFLMLTDLARSFNKYQILIVKDKKQTDKKWAESWKETTPDGKYNLEFEQEAKDLLLKHGWQISFKRADNVEYWTRPNKDPKDGFSATFGHQKNMFYVFSEDASCEPFVSGQAYSPFNIFTELKHSGDWRRSKDELRQRFNMVDNEKFWSVSEKGNYALNNKLFKEFLEANDIFKITPNDKSTYDFIRREGIFINIVYEKDIKDFVLEWIEETKAPDGVFNLMTGNLKFFKRDFLSMLKTKDITPLKDDKNNCFLFYKNCIVKVNATEKTILSYQEQDLSIWKDQVINRDYQLIDHHQSEFRTFVWKISGEDPAKYKAFQTVIGYLVHGHKTNNNNKAIIFNDEMISESPNGRSGKGLFWNGLKQIRKVQSLDGKQFDFQKSFPYQNVSTDCQILVFDDVKKNFNFEQLFSVITEGITIEYKGKDSIKLEVTESPKIIITTNYTIQGDSASFNARKYEVEMSTYFNEHYTPKMEFGHELFNEWDELEWARFDNYIMECVKVYFNEGLLDMPTKNLEYRKIISEIGMECYQFFETLERNEWKNIKSLYDSFLISYPEKSKTFTQNRLTISVKKYAKYHKLEVDIRYSAGVGSLFIADPSLLKKKETSDVWDELNEVARKLQE